MTNITDTTNFRTVLKDIDAIGERLDFVESQVSDRSEIRQDIEYLRSQSSDEHVKQVIDDAIAVALAGSSDKLDAFNEMSEKMKSSDVTSAALEMIGLRLEKTEFEIFKKSIQDALKNLEARGSDTIRKNSTDIVELQRDLRNLANAVGLNELQIEKQADIDEFKELTKEVEDFKKEISFKLNRKADMTVTEGILSETAYTRELTNNKVDKLTFETELGKLDEKISLLDVSGVQAAIDEKFSELVDSSPDALDTLKEFANAINNDADFATNINNQLSLKATKEELNVERLAIAANKAEISLLKSHEKDWATKSETMSLRTSIDILLGSDPLQSVRSIVSREFSAQMTGFSVTQMNVIKNLSDELRKSDMADGLTALIAGKAEQSDLEYEAQQRKNINLRMYSLMENKIDIDVLNTETKNRQEQDVRLHEKILRKLDKAEIDKVYRRIETIEGHSDGSFNKAIKESIDSLIDNNTTALLALKELTFYLSNDQNIGSSLQRQIGEKAPLSKVHEHELKISQNATQLANLLYLSHQIDEIETEVAKLNDTAPGSVIGQLVNSAIDKYLDGAPSALDTLREVADALGNDANAFSNLQQKIALKADKDDVERIEIRYTNYEDRINTQISTLTTDTNNKFDVEEQARIAEDQRLDSIKLNKTIHDAEHNIRVTEEARIEKKAFDANNVEVAARKAADEAIRTHVDFLMNEEKTARNAQDLASNTTQTQYTDQKVATEKQARELADGGLDTKITIEKSERESDISEVNSRITDTNNALSAEVTARNNAITNVHNRVQIEETTRQDQVNNLQSQIDVQKSSTNTEIATVRSEIDQKFNDLIDSSPEQLNTLRELAAALGDDGDFVTTINNKITDVVNRLATEEATRKTADDKLTADLSKEIIDRTNADTDLRNYIDTKDTETDSVVEANRIKAEQDIKSLVDNAPLSMNTLRKIAGAVGNDPIYSINVGTRFSNIELSFRDLRVEHSARMDSIQGQVDDIRIPATNYIRSYRHFENIEYGHGLINTKGTTKRYFHLVDDQQWKMDSLHGMVLYDGDTERGLLYHSDSGFGFKSTDWEWKVKVSDKVVSLFHDNIERLTTSATGISLYGIIDSTDSFKTKEWFINDQRGTGLKNTETGKTFVSTNGDYWTLESGLGMEFVDVFEGTAIGSIEHDTNQVFGLKGLVGTWFIRSSNGGGSTILGTKDNEDIITIDVNGVSIDDELEVNSSVILRDNLSVEGNSHIIGYLRIDGDIQSESWFQNNYANKGLKNFATNRTFYSKSDDVWYIDSKHGLEFGNADTYRGRIHHSLDSIGFMEEENKWFIKHEYSTSNTILFSSGLEKIRVSDDGAEITGRVKVSNYLTVDGNLTVHGEVSNDNQYINTNYGDGLKNTAGTSRYFYLADDEQWKMDSLHGMVVADGNTTRGMLYHSTSGFGLKSPDWNWKVRTDDEKVVLYHIASEKLRTTVDGIKVTGLTDIVGNVQIDGDLNFTGVMSGDFDIREIEFGRGNPRAQAKATGVDILGQLDVTEFITTPNSVISKDGWFHSNKFNTGISNTEGGNKFFAQDAEYWNLVSSTGLNFVRGTDVKGKIVHVSGFFGLQDNNSNWIIECTSGQTTLYDSGTKKLNTTPTGINVAGDVVLSGWVKSSSSKTGLANTTHNLSFYGYSDEFWASKIHSTSGGLLLNDISDATKGQVYFTDSGEFGLRDSAGKWIVKNEKDSVTRLYFNGEEKFKTTAVGVHITGDLVLDGDTYRTVDWFIFEEAGRGLKNQVTGSEFYSKDTETFVLRSNVTNNFMNFESDGQLRGTIGNDGNGVFGILKNGTWRVQTLDGYTAILHSGTTNGSYERFKTTDQGSELNGDVHVKGNITLTGDLKTVEMNIPTKNEFFGEAERNKQVYSGNGFIRFGGSQSGYGGQPIVEGISIKDQLELGLGCYPNSGGAPVVIVDGVTIVLRHTNYNSTEHWTVLIPMPDAPSTVDFVNGREDFVGLKVWYEDVTTNDVVFPYGNVQSKLGTFDGLNCVDSTTIGLPQQYSAFGVWDTTFTGNGIQWSSLSIDDRIKFASEKFNNIYNDGGRVFQVRYKIVVTPNTNDVPDQLPIAVVTRRNIGKYHPRWNRLGTATNGVDKWYSDSSLVDSASCFVSPQGGGVGTDSGREDGKFYNTIHDGDIKDLRMDAKPPVDINMMMENVMRDLPENKIRGWVSFKNQKPMRTNMIVEVFGSETGLPSWVDENYMIVHKTPLKDLPRFAEGHKAIELTMTEKSIGLPTVYHNTDHRSITLSGVVNGIADDAVIMLNDGGVHVASAQLDKNYNHVWLDSEKVADNDYIVLVYESYANPLIEATDRNGVLVANKMSLSVNYDDNISFWLMGLQNKSNSVNKYYRSIIFNEIRDKNGNIEQISHLPVEIAQDFKFPITKYCAFLTSENGKYYITVPFQEVKGSEDDDEIFEPKLTEKTVEFKTIKSGMKRFPLNVYKS